MNHATEVNSGLQWPNRKITTSLLPAWLPKSGSSFDLPIAIAILGASGLFTNIEGTLFVGELSLEGALRDTRGGLSKWNQESGYSDCKSSGSATLT